jgi:hypothetical protein
MGTALALTYPDSCVEDSGVKMHRNRSFARTPARVWDILILAGFLARILLARVGASGATPQGYQIGPGDVLEGHRLGA